MNPTSILLIKSWERYGPELFGHSMIAETLTSFKIQGQLLLPQGFYYYLFGVYF
jgi:hypothetical protein